MVMAGAGKVPEEAFDDRLRHCPDQHRRQKAIGRLRAGVHGDFQPYSGKLLAVDEAPIGQRGRLALHAH